MADRVERVSEETQVADGRVVTDRAVTTHDRDDSVAKVAQIVWFLVGLLLAFLLLRFILALLGANPANSFASFIYNVSDIFVAPFRGLLQVGAVQLGIARFELETLVAIAIYTLLGWGIVKLIDLGRRQPTV